MSKRLTGAAAYTFAGGGALGALSHLDVLADFEEIPIGLETAKKNLSKLGVEVFTDRKQWPVAQYRGKVSVLVGAPPCHGFASCNTMNAGCNHRDNVYMARFAKLVVDLDVQVAAFDMVPRFISLGLPLLQRIARYWKKHGYATTVVKTNAHDVGMPQRRRRLAVIAHKVALDVPNVSPGALSFWDAVSDLRGLELKSGKQAYARDAKTMWQSVMRAEKKLDGDLLYAGLAGPSSGIRWHQVNHHYLDRVAGWMQEHRDNHNGYARTLDRHLLEKLMDAPKSRRPGFMCKLLEKSEPCPTITGGPNYLHPTESRILTPAEHTRAMGYPDWYEFVTMRESDKARLGDVYTQIGKAVPPTLMAEAVGHITRAVKRGDEKVELGRVLLLDRQKRPMEVRELCQV